MKRPTIRAAELLADAKEGAGLTRRSPLFLWMRENYADLSTAFAKDRPDWKALAAAFNRAGLRSRGEKPVLPETARKAWKMAKDEAKAAGLAARPAARPLSTPVPELPALRTVGGVNMPPSPVSSRPKISLRPAAPLAPGEQPEDDGSTLPRPITRNSKD